MNGVEGREPRGKQVELPAPAGPEGTFVEEGGGLDHLPAA